MKTFHVGFSPTSTQPLPITFYLSPEILADDGYSEQDLAHLLRHALALAIKNHRQVLGFSPRAELGA